MLLVDIESVYDEIVISFSGAFAKFRKAIIRFVMSIRLSFLMKQLGSYWTDFYEIWYLGFLNLSRKFP